MAPTRVWHFTWLFVVIFPDHLLYNYSDWGRLWTFCVSSKYSKRLNTWRSEIYLFCFDIWPNWLSPEIVVKWPFIIHKFLVLFQQPARRLNFASTRYIRLAIHWFTMSNSWITLDIIGNLENDNSSIISSTMVPYALFSFYTNTSFCIDRLGSERKKDWYIFLSDCFWKSRCFNKYFLVHSKRKLLILNEKIVPTPHSISKDGFR